MGFLFNSLNLATSLLASWEDCLSLALDDAVLVWPCCPPHTAAAVQYTASSQKTRKNTVTHNSISSLGVYKTFHFNMWGAQKHKTPRNMSTTSLPRFCNSFTGRLMICVLQWQCSLAWSYLSLIQNCSITHMHTLVPANTGELHRPCQPRCDTEHDNVCNLLHVVCLPSALPFEVLPPVPLQPYCNSTTEPEKSTWSVPNHLLS